jgi:hypothetical protein
MKVQEMMEINGEFYPYAREATLEEERMPSVSKEEQVALLKQKLADTDYKAIKYAEGWISEEEYEPIKMSRQKLRDEINELESLI